MVSETFQLSDDGKHRLFLHVEWSEDFSWKERANKDLGEERSGSDAETIPKEFSLRHALQVHHPDADSSKSSTSLTTTKPKTANKHRPLVTGHRGSVFDAVENSRESFQRCIDLQCDAVELDVFCVPKSATDPAPVVIVFHGGGTDQRPGLLEGQFVGVHAQKDGETTTVMDLTLDQVQKLQFNPDYSGFPCPRDKILEARIATLQDVLQDLKGTGVHVKIELKGPNTVEPVLETVEGLQMMDQCSYSCFNHDRLKQLRELRPDRKAYPTSAVFPGHVPDDFLQRALQCGATSVHLRYDTCTRERIAQIRAAGLKSMAWFRGPAAMKNDTTGETRKFWDVGNEDEACYQAVIDTGVQDLCVNRPDVLLNLLAKQQTRRSRGA